MKITGGGSIMKFRQELRLYFDKVHNFRPNSTRADSSEFFLVCIGLDSSKIKDCKESNTFFKSDRDIFFKNANTKN